VGKQLDASIPCVSTERPSFIFTLDLYRLKSLGRCNVRMKFGRALEKRTMILHQDA